MAGFGGGGFGGGGFGGGGGDGFGSGGFGADAFGGNDSGGFGGGGGFGNDGGGGFGGGGFGSGGVDEFGVGSASFDADRKNKKDKRQKSRGRGDDGMQASGGNNDGGFGASAFGTSSPQYRDRNRGMDAYGPSDPSSPNRYSSQRQDYRGSDDRRGDDYGRSDGYRQGDQRRGDDYGLGDDRRGDDYRRSDQFRPGDDYRQDSYGGNRLGQDTYGGNRGPDARRGDRNRQNDTMYRDSQGRYRDGPGDGHLHMKDRYHGVQGYDPWKDVPDRPDLGPTYTDRLQETLGADYLVHHGPRSQTYRDRERPAYGRDTRAYNGGMPATYNEAIPPTSPTMHSTWTSETKSRNIRPAPANPFLKSIPANFQTKDWRSADQKANARASSALSAQPLADLAWWPLPREATRAREGATSLGVTLGSFPPEAALWQSVSDITHAYQRATPDGVFRGGSCSPRAYAVEMNSSRRSGSFNGSYAVPSYSFGPGREFAGYGQAEMSGMQPQGELAAARASSQQRVRALEMYRGRARSSSPMSGSRQMMQRSSSPPQSRRGMYSSPELEFRNMRQPNDWYHDRRPTSQQQHHRSLHRAPPLYASSEILASMPWSQGALMGVI